MPNSVIDLQHAPLIEWCMVGCEPKNSHQKTCVKMRCEYMLKICQPLLGAIVNMIEETFIPIVTYNLYTSSLT